MNEADLRKLLDDVSCGAMRPDDALAVLRRLPFAEMGGARIDHHRSLRTGHPEAVYAPGKTPTQCAEIVAEMLTSGSGPVLLTRADSLQVQASLAKNPEGTAMWNLDEASSGEGVGSGQATVVWRPSQQRFETVVVASAGTADQAVATEAAATLSAFGITAVEVSDIGVAGLHRLLSEIDTLATADVVIVTAGMEGALATAVAGVTSAPVVAVPTSAGYGAALDGVTALLAMHSSCAAGLSVVGIDNGFGAAMAVMRILDFAVRRAGSTTQDDSDD